MRIVLTGCCGKVGRACGEHLVASGHDVLGVDVSGGRGRPHPVFQADLLEPMAIHRALDEAERGDAGVGAIVHLANHPKADVGAPEVVLRENLSINASVFMAAAERGVGRVVFSSSVQGALGGIEREFDGGTGVLPPRLPVDESIEARPTNAYGLSKLITERMLGTLCAMSLAGGLTGVSLRLPFVMSERGFEMNARRHGPSEHLWGVTEAFMYVHSTDAAEAVRLACEAEEIDGHEIVWIAAPDPRPPDEIGTLAERVYGDVPGVEESVRRGSFVDTSRAERVLGWRAARVLREARAADASA